MERIDRVERPARVEPEKVVHQKKQQVWRPPEKIPNFDGLIPGYHTRWVRHSTRGIADDANVLGRIHQGYEPVRPQELGEAGINLLTMETGKHAGTVISGDLMLMKIPEHMKAQRDKFYADKARRLQMAVDQKLEESDDELMPISKSVKSQTTTGRPNFKED